LTGYTSIRYELRGPVAHITFNRPEKLNALSRAMTEETGRAFAEARSDDAVRVVVLKGAGRAFCAGADLSPAGATVAGPHSVPDDAFAILAGVNRWLEVWHFPKPVIAQVHGYCLGGGAHVASFCDLVIVAEDSQIGWPKLPVGGGFISPVWSWFVGPRRAKEFSFLVGTVFSGREAAEMGWANRAVPAAELDGYVQQLAERVARVPADILRVKKEAINRTLDLQGFTTSVQLTAAWDALAHASPSVEVIRRKIRELGLRGAIAWFEQGGSAQTEAEG
jgi:enoyl-CoA hydratase